MLTTKQMLVRAGNICKQLMVDGASEVEACDETAIFLEQFSSGKSNVVPCVPIASLRWAESGFPCVLPAAKLAASLMATKIAPDVIDSLEFPWKCFVVEIPPDILSTPTTGAPFLMWVSRNQDRSVDHVTFYDRLVNTGSQKALSTYLNQDHWDNHTELAFDDAALDDMTRVQHLCWRLLVGVCAEMSGTDTPSRTASKNSERKRKFKEPTSWTYVLRRDVSKDVRQHVTDYAAGRTRKPVSVQTLVCGHWRNQAHGVGRLLRKLIHIEPAWRGPEDAPIVVRSHKLGLT
jgi:hypothetical protein